MPLPVADRHPSGSILAAGGELRLMSLPANSRTPQTSVITTAGAVSANATSMTVTTTAPVLIDQDFDLVFGATTVQTATDSWAWAVPTLTTTAAVVANATTISVTAVAAFLLPLGARITFAGVTVETTAAVTVGTTATNVAIRPAPGAIASAAQSTNTIAIKASPGAILTAVASTAFLPTLTLLGVQSVSRPNKSNLISIRSLKSGLGNEQRPTMVDFSMQVSGWVHQRDQAYRRILEPASQQALEVWAEHYSASGRFIRGAAFIADVSNEEKNDDVIKYSGTIGFQGIPSQGDF